MINPKDVFDYISEDNEPWKKAVQVVLLVRRSYASKMTPDGFFLMMVYPSYTDKSVWSFNSVDEMMERLGEGITFGFDPANENEIKEKLWEELIKFKEKEMKRP